jgi:hypothetical protein
VDRALPLAVAPGAAGGPDGGQDTLDPRLGRMGTTIPAPVGVWGFRGCVPRSFGHFVSSHPRNYTYEVTKLDA